MAALARAATKKRYPAQIVLVISNRPDAAGLVKAENLGIPTLCYDHTEYSSRRAFEAVLDIALTAAEVELICLAGFMRVLTPWFTQKWAGKMINIHPSLLPHHKGLHTHRRAIEAKDRYHGCTVHWVSAGVDEGEVILQDRLRIRRADTSQTLAARVLKLEHKLYPKALKQIAAQMNKSGNL